MTDLYFILFLISLVFLGILINISREQDSRYFVLLFITITFVDLAYWFLYTARTTDEALIATKFTYFSGSFQTAFLCMCTMDILRIKVKPWLSNMLIAIGTISMLAVFTIGHNKLFYKSASLSIVDGVSYLVKEYGVLHTVYQFLLIAYMLYPIVAIVYAFTHQTKASYKYSVLLTIAEITSISVYLIERGIGYKYELLPVAFFVAEIIMLYIVMRIGKYDVSRTATLSREALKEYGYIILGMNKDYIGCDDNAAFFFPELLNVKIDKKVKDPFIKKEFIDWIDDYENGNTSYKIYERNGCVLKVSMNRFQNAANTKQTGYIIEIADDTEQRNLINELANMNRQLEVAVDQANNANKAKSDFLANMSHEIRTPINAVLGLNEMIIRESSEKEILDYAKDVKVAGSTLLSLINDILDVSKIESGRMELVPVSYNILAAIKDVENMIRKRAEDKGLKLTVDVDPNLPVILYGDEIRIKQIITNILTNAVKYTEKGWVKLTVGFDKNDDKNISLNVAVADSGIGIKKEDFEKLTKPFERVDEERNRHVEGTGLGMTIVNSFLSMMGSKLSVESEYGKGSTFSFKVNQVVEHWKSEGAPTNNPAQGDKKEYVPMFTAPEARVLVVDDNKINLTVCKGLLKKTKVIITTALSGAEALEKCSEVKYDIILLDHMMPEMDGVETLHKLKENPDGINVNTPVIALTANAVSGIRDKYIADGFDNYLPKPIEPNDLEGMLMCYIPSEKIIVEKS